MLSSYGASVNSTRPTSFVVGDAGIHVHQPGARLRSSPTNPYASTRRPTGTSSPRALEVSHIPVDYQALFLEVLVDDSSDFEDRTVESGVVRHGHRVLEVHGPVVPNTLASVLLHIPT